MRESSSPDVDNRYVFWHQQLALLGDQDPLKVLGESPVQLMRWIQEYGSASWTKGPEGRWSPVQILTHLLDVECTFAFRIRTILYDERPRLMAMDQDRWVAGQAAHGVGAGERIGEFCQVREVNLRLWRRLGDEELSRVGFHEDAGIELSLRTLRGIQAGHDLWHLRALRDMLTS